LAHELGHILLNDPYHNYGVDNFMAQTDYASGKDEIEPDQVRDIRQTIEANPAFSQ
jgi:hypothetical protein